MDASALEPERGFEPLTYCLQNSCAAIAPPGPGPYPKESNTKTIRQSGSLPSIVHPFATGKEKGRGGGGGQALCDESLLLGPLHGLGSAALLDSRATDSIGRALGRRGRACPASPPRAYARGTDSSGDSAGAALDGGRPPSANVCRGTDSPPTTESSPGGHLIVRHDADAAAAASVC